MGNLDLTALEDEIAALIREFSTAEGISVEPDMTFDQLGVSSLDVLQIIFRIEESHGITIDTGKFHEVKTVGDVVNYVYGALS